MGGLRILLDPLNLLHEAKTVLALGAIVLIFLYWFFEHRGITKGRLFLDVALAALAIISIPSYFDFHFRHFMNAHDVFHYYMGAKYSHEVGYFDLYQCAAVATLDGVKLSPETVVRRMDTYRYVAVKDVLKNAGQYKSRFSEARWEEFQKDCRYFQSQEHGLGGWLPCLTDMGYNATPVWSMTGRFLTAFAPTSSPVGMRFLLSLDLFFIAAMTLVVCRAFDWRTGLFALIFFCTCFWMAYTIIRGCFLRLDWVALLVMAVAMLKANRYKTAAALLAYSVMTRVFPLIFAFGLGAKFLWDIGRTRRLNRRYLEFFVTLAVVCVLLLAATACMDGGLQPWKDFASKIKVHNAHIAPTRVGFKYVFLGIYKPPPGGVWPPFKTAKIQQFHDWRVVWWTIQGIVLLIALYLAKNLDDYETIPFCYAPAYFLTAPTFYYHVMVLAPLFLFLPKRAHLPRAIGTAAIFSISIVLYVLNVWLPVNMMLSFLMSCILLGVSLFIMGFTCRARPTC